MKRYLVMARWWNGTDWDMVSKEAKTKDQAIGAAKLLLKQVHVFQISITDRQSDSQPPPAF